MYDVAACVGESDGFGRRVLVCAVHYELAPCRIDGLEYKDKPSEFFWVTIETDTEASNSM